jgi:hypothetical protein
MQPTTITISGSIERKVSTGIQKAERNDTKVCGALHRGRQTSSNDLADLTDREAVSAWGQGRRCAHGGQRVIAVPSASAEPAPARRLYSADRERFPRQLIGANAMRSILVLSLFMTLCASANAATLHHHRARHHVVLPAGVASSFAAVPRSAYAPPRPTDPYDDTPSYNDPSKFGGGTALPVQN